MKENVQKLVRIIYREAIVLMFCAVFIKFAMQQDDWKMRAILWTVSSTIAYVIRVYYYSKYENTTNFIGWMIGKKPSKYIIEDYIMGAITTTLIGIIYLFVIGMILQINEYEVIVFEMIMIFMITYVIV